MQQQTTRAFSYAALAQLAERMPAVVFGSDPAAVASRFFTALQLEPPTVASGVRESMSVMARAVAAHLGALPAATGAEARLKLHALLLQTINARSDAARMAAVQWARRVFDFDDLGMWLQWVWGALHC